MTETKEGATAVRTTRTKIVTIVKKGMFATDRFFNDVREDFQASVKEMVTKLKIKVSRGADEFVAYRNLRKLDPKNENQAVAQKDTKKGMKVREKGRSSLAHTVFCDIEYFRLVILNLKPRIIEASVCLVSLRRCTEKSYTNDHKCDRGTD